MEKLFKKLNIKPQDKNIYKEAFIHTSYANENNIKSYETLEFLGDAIVDLIVSDYLYKNKDLTEGEMTTSRARYVCENALYEYANHLNLSEYIKVGKGEQKSDGVHKKAIMADTFESLMAAIYLDLGFDTVKQVIESIISPYIENDNIVLFKDYKSKLQEVVQDLQQSLEYILIGEQGPAHDKHFKISVSIDNIIYGIGQGHTKKEAEQEAAKEALKKLVTIKKIKN